VNFANAAPLALPKQKVFLSFEKMSLEFAMTPAKIAD
jgi:hypothetical protein